MGSAEIMILAWAASALGFIHTLFGPDHYLPFIVISRARKWPFPQTLAVSFFCGLGHVLSSALVGFLGIALGMAVSQLEWIESFRGKLAAWLLIGFGLAYFLWGLRRARKSKPHEHSHFHSEHEAHSHPHSHRDEHYHLHFKNRERTNITPWILFTIFVFGPCEPLIPLIIYTAAKHTLAAVILVAGAFSLATILTMLVIIALSSWGISFLTFGRLERYLHALAGATIFISGLSVHFLRL